MGRFSRSLGRTSTSQGNEDVLGVSPDDADGYVADPDGDGASGDQPLGPDYVEGDVADHVGDGTSGNQPPGLVTRGGLRRGTGIPGQNKWIVWQERPLGKNASLGLTATSWNPTDERFG